MKTAVIAALVGSAAAFAPAPVAKTSTSLNAFENELGAQVRRIDCFFRTLKGQGAPSNNCGNFEFATF